MLVSKRNIRSLYIFKGLLLELPEAPLLWPPNEKSWFIGKYPDDGKYWRQKNRVVEDETFRQHHWLNGHEFEQTQGDTGGQRSLPCHSSWGHKESDRQRMNYDSSCIFKQTVIEKEVVNL